MDHIMVRKDVGRVQHLEAEILRLDVRVRAALAKSLLDSLDSLSEEEYEELWTEEAEARFADFKAGRTSAVDGNGVFARARARNR
jgi:putative addiction module component (TIGR02574 family)